MKNKKVTISQLKSLINEEVKKLNKRSILEEKREMLLNELGEIDRNIMRKDEHKIIEGYLEAALWTEEEEIGKASIIDFSEESRKSVNNDVNEFVEKAGELLNGIEPSQIGHDLWLTRNGHGAGFWDRGLGEVGEKLSEIARSMGEKHIYIGDDDKIHFDFIEKSTLKEEDSSLEIERDSFMLKLKDKYPKAWFKKTEDFYSEPQWNFGVWTGEGSYSNDGTPIFNTYEDSSSLYEDGVYKEFHDFVESQNWYIEQYDSGTYMIYKD